ncbi:hypothetical protein NPX13_g1531 [Xylaria arbuscula]|uniref:Uncharacterized protein n=1 Tax=Xylaria arbuscula TaxID=114810 RepID=A0A9W8NMB2_9PEZI|nr:hypothetical protein NPX13_g1531 [Xylaria arbuscula]
MEQPTPGLYVDSSKLEPLPLRVSADMKATTQVHILRLSCREKLPCLLQQPSKTPSPSSTPSSPAFDDPQTTWLATTRKENTITHPYENPDHLHDCLVSMGFEKEKILVKAQKEEISKYFKSKKREERKNAAVEDDV